MDRLFEKFAQKRTLTPLGFQRYLIDRIDWNNRLIGIKGARGAGKTTLLLQHASKTLPPGSATLYVSLDDLYFRENTLVELGELFVKQGGKYLLLDEVHRYENWSQEIKNLYDDFPELKIIFTGSSLIHIEKAKADLSRRSVIYELYGLSFREFLDFTLNKKFSPIKLELLLSDHSRLATEVVGAKLRPLEHFQQYLKSGYYPYFKESEAAYAEKLASTVMLSLETDLPSVHPVQFSSIEKIKLLLAILAESVPFKPNVAKLSERIGITRNSLISFLSFLEDLRIIKQIHADAFGVTRLQKPDKIYLHHPNHHHALGFQNPNAGTIRESFFINQVGTAHRISAAEKGDFVVDEKYTFEIGGKEKTDSQIKDVRNSYLALDGIEIGHQKIPLWLFGFLY